MKIFRILATTLLTALAMLVPRSCADAPARRSLIADPHGHFWSGGAGNSAAGRDAGTTDGSVPMTGHGGSHAAGHDGGHGNDDSGAGGGLDAALDAGGEDAGPPIASTDPGLRVAFLGDQGIGPDADAVLQLVKRERADMLIIGGDFAYTPDVAGWSAQLDNVLGPDFPYFVAVGNHDLDLWAGPNGFQAVAQARLDRIAGAACSGDLGVNSVCRYRGLVFVLSGVGTLGSQHEAFLDRALENDSVWRLCIWHKNQHDMQVGAKLDEVGWLAYQICQNHGAPIITAHEHSYGRTRTLTALGNAAEQHGYVGAPGLLTFEPGKTAVFQSGLGGYSYRVWNGEANPWWATIYAANKQQINGVTVGTAPQIEFGALFIDFHVDGDPRKARGYFKTTSNTVVDNFTMYVR